MSNSPGSPTSGELTRSRQNSFSFGSNNPRLLLPTAAPTSIAVERGVESDNDNVKVCCRVRPFNDRELQLHQKEQEKLSPRNRMPVRSMIEMNGRDTIYLDPSDYQEKERFGFDESLWSILDDQQTSPNPYTSQADVFQIIGAPVLKHAWKGFHSCVFAYGQTGSGKTHTMMGSESDPGLIPRLCTALFSQINDKQEEIRNNPNPLHEVTYQVEVRFMEIYMEKVHDLLSETTDGKPNENLRVRHHPTQGPFVEGLNSFVVGGWEDCKRLINLGNAERITAETKMNERSSRSHAVFKLTFIQTTKSIPKNKFERATVNERFCHISLVDLAGSERNKKSEAVGIHLTEAANINKSLSTLKKVIDALVEQSEANRQKKKVKVNIPFRESTLTWLLSENLGGNSKTTMLCTVSPHTDNAEETLLTLRYGLRARGIVCVVRVNEDTHAKQILELQNRLQELQLQADVAAADDSKDLLLDEIEVGRKAMESMQEKIREEEERSRGLSEAIQKERQARYSGAYYQSFKHLATVRINEEKLRNVSAKLTNVQADLQDALERVHTLEIDKRNLEQKVRTMGSDNDTYTLQLDQAKVKIQELQREYATVSAHVHDTREKDKELERYKELVSLSELKRQTEVSDLQTRVCAAKILGVYKLKRQRREFQNLVMKERIAAEQLRQQKEAEYKYQVDALTSLMADNDLAQSDANAARETTHNKEISALEATIGDLTKRIKDLETIISSKESEELRQRAKHEQKCKDINDEWFAKNENEKKELKAEISRLKVQFGNEIDATEYQLRTNHDSSLKDVRQEYEEKIAKLEAELGEERELHAADIQKIIAEKQRVISAQEDYLNDMRSFVTEHCETETAYKKLYTQVLSVLSNKNVKQLSGDEIRDLLGAFAYEYEMRGQLDRTALQRLADPQKKGNFSCEKAPQLAVTPARALGGVAGGASPDSKTGGSATKSPAPVTNASGRIPIRRQTLKPKKPLSD